MLLQANGEPVENRLDLTREINLNGGSEMTVLVEREGQRETMALRPHFDADSRRWLAGVTVELADSREVRRSRPIWEAVPASFVGTWELLVLLKQSVTGMVSAGSAPELSGPIGIAQMTGEVSRNGGLAGWLAERGHSAEHQPGDHQHPAVPDAGWGAHRLRGDRMGAPREAHLAGEGGADPPGGAGGDNCGVVAISANDIMRLLEGGTFVGG